MNKQQLASKIWAAANKMRSKIEANEYKDYILGFIFYKFLSDQELEFLRSEGVTDADMDSVNEDDQDVVDLVRSQYGYFISYGNLFSTWLAKGRDFSVGDVTDALSAFDRLVSRKRLFGGIFATLQAGLSKLGETAAARSRAIQDLVYLIKDIPTDSRQDYDVLGFIYEYLIGNFAANAGKKAGEFYTPHEVSVLMSEIIAEHLKGRTEIKIYDSCSGSGSLLINIGRSVARRAGNSNGIVYYAQELKANTYNLTRMNLVMRGISSGNINVRNGDTLEDDWPYFDEDDPAGTYDPLYVDAVVSNPPYSQPWDPSGKDTDPRYARFGLAPRGKADYAFLLHDLYHLKPDGIMAIVLPHGVLFRGGEEGEIRKNLIEGNHIDTIIGLPANVFFGTGIPTIIMVLKQERKNTDVLFIDASRHFMKSGKSNVLRACDIKRIADAVRDRKDIPGFAALASRDLVREQGYNLNIPRYVDSSERDGGWDISALMRGGIPERELDALKAYWDAFPGLEDDLFARGQAGYRSVSVPDIGKAVAEHRSVLAYKDRYAAAFAGFDAFLREQLLDGMGTVDIQAEEAVLGDAIFSRLDGVPLIDKYDAYEVLDGSWKGISADLEIIRMEGFDAVRQVDPRMVVKKKDGKESEVQDGWIGHVIPFGLVQERMMGAALDDIAALEGRLSAVQEELGGLLEELGDDAAGMAFVNDAGDGFVTAEVKKALKGKSAAPEVRDVLKKADAPLGEEKELKKRIKASRAELESATKSAIEGLSDAEALDLLRAKWIEPVMDGLMALRDVAIAAFAGKLEALRGKYGMTFAGVEDDIASAESALASMLGDLSGSAADMDGLAMFRKLLGGA